jgi:hypothetical protein
VLILDRGDTMYDNVQVLRVLIEADRRTPLSTNTRVGVLVGWYVGCGDTGDTQGVSVVMSVSPSIPNQAFIEAVKRATVSLGVTGIQNYDPANVSRFVRFAKTLKRIGFLRST